MIKILTRQEIVDEIEEAKRFTWISDQGYWSRQGLIEHWELNLKRFDEGQTIVA